MKERLAALGAIASPGSSHELGILVRTEHERYGKLIREANIKAN